MRTLFKWAFRGACGYLIYKIATQLAAEFSATPAQKRQPKPRNASNMTGHSGQGISVPVTDATGVERTAKVGRGVIS
jgi:hypothetical protein